MGVLTASRAAMRVDDQDAANQSSQSALAQVATYIPSDVVATYVALQGIFSKASNPVKWSLFGIGVALCILLPVLNYITSRNPSAAGGSQQAAGNNKQPPWLKQITVIIMAMVAFTAYAMALPSTVFASVLNSATLWGAAAALVLAVLMPSIASAFGIKPTAGP